LRLGIAEQDHAEAIATFHTLDRADRQPWQVYPDRHISAQNTPKITKNDTVSGDPRFVLAPTGSDSACYKYEGFIAFVYKSSFRPQRPPSRFGLCLRGNRQFFTYKDTFLNL
jgi:hypothetical protein